MLAGVPKIIFCCSNLQSLHLETRADAMEKFYDAIDFLTEEHQSILNLFDAFEVLGDKSAFLQKRIGTSIIETLTLHTQLEEEIFYPKVRRTIRDNELMDKALVDHGEVDELITHLKFANPAKSEYTNTVKMLIKKMREHLVEEEQLMFPRVRESELDLRILGLELLERKRELEEEYGANIFGVYSTQKSHQSSPHNRQH